MFFCGFMEFPLVPSTAFSGSGGVGHSFPASREPHKHGSLAKPSFANDTPVIWAFFNDPDGIPNVRETNIGSKIRGEIFMSSLLSR